jgi:hypothetical protein
MGETHLHWVAMPVEESTYAWLLMFWISFCSYIGSHMYTLIPMSVS